MSFAAPVLLVFLLAVPAAIAAYAWLERRRDARASKWAAPALLSNMVSRPPALRRHLPTALILAGVTLLLVGFARPKAHITVSRQEATVVIVLDVSGSMAANDVHPSRIAAARATALRLVDALPKGYRIAVITFSDHTAVVAPPTHDLTQVRAAIAAAKSGPQGTALADAVMRGIDVGLSVHGTGNVRPPAIVVVLSDGGQTAGRVSPQQAANRALRSGIPVSTVLVGTPDGIVHQALKGGFDEQIQVPAQPSALQLLARSSGGRYYAGVAALDIKGTYAALGSRVGHRRKSVEVTSVAAGGGIAFLLAGAAMSGLWFRRVL